MKLDFLICGSATDAFFSQIAFFRLCLNALGGVYSNARVVAVFGDHEVEMLPNRWRSHFDGIEVEWDSSSPGYDENCGSYAGRHYRRFELVRTDADLAILCDADVACVKPFDDLIGDLTASPALAGVIAYTPLKIARFSRDMVWPQLSKVLIGREMETPYRYSLYDRDDVGGCPFFVNYGVFMGTPDLLREFHRRAVQLQSKVYGMTESWHACQITVPLVCADLQLPTRSLPMRYNWPNDERPERIHPEEMEHIRFLHYMKTHEFDRHEVFSDEGLFDVFVNGKMAKRTNEIFRRHVHELTQGRYPFSESDNEISANFSNKIDESSRWMRSLRSINRMFRR